LLIPSSRPLDQVHVFLANGITRIASMDMEGVKGVRIVLLKGWESVCLDDFTLVR
ncbi:hypothetical protein Tco_0338000, partial [Tanacetum coccineum]